jgi:hypothetical protein
MTQVAALRLRTSREKAARRREEKRLAAEVAKRAQALVDARGYAEIYLARALYLQAAGQLKHHHTGGGA